MNNERHGSPAVEKISHPRYPERGLRKSWRVLKPGGSLLLLEQHDQAGKLAQRPARPGSRL